MRIDGMPGEVYIRWSGGNLQFVNKADGTVLMEINPNNNTTEQAVASLGDITIFGRVLLPSGELLANADEINDAGRYSRSQKIFVGNLGTAAAADDMVFSWTNAEGEDVIITRVVVDVTKAGGTATATIDVGSAADATTGSSNLITGGDLNAVAVYDSLDLVGAGVATFVKVADGECVNGQAKTEKAEALEGKYYIFYVVGDS